MERVKANLARKMVDSNVLLEGEFELSSGRVSEYYVDKYKFVTDVDLLTEVVSIASRHVGAEQKPVGIELGSVPIVSTMSIVNGDFAIVRSDEKDYGTENRIEGSVGGERVVLVEDIITTGSTVNECIEVLRDAGATVDGVVVVVDRSHMEKINGVPVEPILSIEDLKYIGSYEEKH